MSANSKKQVANDISAFSQVADSNNDPELDLTPRYVFEPRPIEFGVKFEGVVMTVGDLSKTPIPVANASFAASCANALEYLRRSFFGHIQLGLHLYPTVGMVKGIPYDENIGAVGSLYVPQPVGPNGEVDMFNRWVASEGYATLSKRHGRLVGYPIVVTDFVPGERRSAGHARNADGLHLAIDALLQGNTYSLCPVLWKSGEAMSGEELRAARLAWVAKRAELYGMDDKAYRQSHRQMIIDQNAFQASGKFAAELQRLSDEGTPAPVIDTIAMKDGSIGTLETLDGKELKRYYHNAPVGGTVKVNADSWARIAGFIKQQGYTAVVIAAPVQ